MPGVSPLRGIGRAPGSDGARVSNTGGEDTPDRMPCTRARKLGGRGATLSSACSTDDRCSAYDNSGLGPREKVRPKNQHIASTAIADSAAPAMESVLEWTFSLR